jgi:hypothetical protein
LVEVWHGDSQEASIDLREKVPSSLQLYVAIP